MTNKELDILACKKFVCPNIGLIDQKGKELELKDETIKKAKDLAVEYFKRTYHSPRYSSVKSLLPSFVLAASILEGDRRFQSKVAKAFGVSNATIRKWYIDIIDTMDLKIEQEKEANIEKIHGHIIKRSRILTPDLNLIEKGGKTLGLNNQVIKRAKDLAVKYFKKIYFKSNYPQATEDIIPSLLYLASIIENDGRNQMEISLVFNVSESYISRWYRKILDALDMKLIWGKMYGKERKILKVIEKT